jgi:hypothetical protein
MFLLSSGGTVNLPDGSRLQTSNIFWEGGDPYIGSCKGTYGNHPWHKDWCQSIVIFRSVAPFTKWSLQGTIANASDYPNSWEGPNEHDVVMLADGKTILSVFRTDGGDGDFMKLANYMQTRSTSFGKTWSKGVTIPAGTARPRLLLLGSTLVLSGGRHITGSPCVQPQHGYICSNFSWEPALWVSADGMGKQWSELYSVSDQHNKLETNNSRRFTPCVNGSDAAPYCASPPYVDGGHPGGALFSTAYTSLLRTGAESAMLTYDQLPAPDTGSPYTGTGRLWSMRFSVVRTGEEEEMNVEEE